MTSLAAGRRCPSVAVDVAFDVAVDVVVDVVVEVDSAVEESSVERSGTGGSSTARGYLSTINAPPPTPLRYTSAGVLLPSAWCGRSAL